MVADKPLNREMVKKLLISKQSFASVRQTAAPIIALSGNPNATIKDLAAVIEKDPELSARILKIANSGFYSIRNKIESVSHATVLLGWNAIKMITIGSSILTRMCATDRPLFNHSMRTAQIARFLASEASFYKVEEIAVVGLLHDFGEVILEIFFPERHAVARKLAMDKGIPIHLAEREVLDIDHGEVGGWTLEEWDMPENITESVARHHSFDRNTYHARKTAVIHVADVLAFAVDYRGPDWEKVPEMSLDALEVLGFSENELKDMLLAIMRMRFDPLII
jgi:putative nucleotidyltransferase with HDIG domain